MAQLPADAESPPSRKPYLLACAVQAIPIIAWATRSEALGDSGRSFMLFLAWGNVASFASGAIIGATSVKRLTQIGKCLTPILAVGALAVLIQSGKYYNPSVTAIYMIVAYLITQGPGALLGGALGSFAAEEVRHGRIRHSTTRRIILAAGIGFLFVATLCGYELGRFIQNPRSGGIQKMIQGSRDRR